MEKHNSTLVHYGVKGMKWGIRRYQDKNGRLTAEGRKHYGFDSSKSNSISKQDYVKSKTADSLVNKFSNNAAKDMTGTVEIPPVLAFYAAEAIIMYGVSKVSDKIHRANRMKELEELNRTKEIKSFKEAPKLKKPSPPEEGMKVTNPGFMKEMGTTMNCTFCTTALALRERGYNVKATKTNDGMFPDEFFAKTFNSKEIKMGRVKDKYDVLTNLSKEGDGAYGNLSVYWKLGGGHSIFWKNEKGKTRIYDGQSGKEITETASSTRVFLDQINKNKVRYNRLDNCDPTEYALAVVERNDKK